MPLSLYMKVSFRNEKPEMKKMNASAAVALTLACCLTILASCGGKGHGNHFPKGFADWHDARKVQYVMDNASPDSVARFLCAASLGKIEGVKIDTLPTATLYVMENYPDSCLQSFAEAYDAYVDGASLKDRMRLYRLAASEDPMKLGYELGLHYVNKIRVNGMTPEEVEAEIAELQRACADDTVTFTRFRKGFRVALTVDGAADIPKSIYDKYSK